MTANYPDMTGRVAVVTGAAQGMGLSHTRELARQGVHVIAGDRNQELLKGAIGALTSEGHAGRVVPVEADVSVRADHEALAAAALNHFGQLNYWVNNAGIFPAGLLTEVSDEDIEAVVAVNVKGALFGTQVASAAMKDGDGSIVNISSIAAWTVRPQFAAYGISKAAEDHLTRIAAVELGPRGIRVNAIAPGMVETAMTSWVRDDEDAMNRTLAQIPLRRFSTPVEVSDALLFLLSNSASFITGHTLVVDGGGQHR